MSQNNQNDQESNLNQASSLEDQKRELLARVIPVSDLKTAFIASCKETKQRISTGVLSLDILLNGGFQKELYIMSAETSTGKSAFMMHMAQYIAFHGVDVLYFTLEMSKKELIARGVSEISYERHLENRSCIPVTAGDILYYQYDSQIRIFTRLGFQKYADYTDEYFKRYGDHLYIIEPGLGGMTANDIANTVFLHQKRTGGQPLVVYVDYLQIISPDPDDRTQADRKNKIDCAVLTLKRLASQMGVPVFVASSISRSGYGQKISTASFKESGDTEYTGSILLGWNWDGVTNANKGDAEIEKIECKKRGYRNMTLDILKYRNGERDAAVKLRYYPEYNYFCEDK